MGHQQSSASNPSNLSSSVSHLTPLPSSVVVCEDGPLITPNAAGRPSAYTAYVVVITSKVPLGSHHGLIWGTERERKAGVHFLLFHMLEFLYK